MSNYNETEQFKSLKWAVERLESRTKGFKDFVLTENHSSPSNEKDYIKNIDAILELPSMKFYIQMASVHPDPFIRTEFSKLISSKKNNSNIVTFIPYQMSFEEFLINFRNEMKQIVVKKNDYKNWPSLNSEHATLFILSYQTISISKIVDDEFRKVIWDFITLIFQTIIYETICNTNFGSLILSTKIIEKWINREQKLKKLENFGYRDSIQFHEVIFVQKTIFSNFPWKSLEHFLESESARSVFDIAKNFIEVSNIYNAEK